MAKKNKQPNTLQVNCVTDKGGSVLFNKEHKVWASYAVATAGDLAPPELFYANLLLPNGKTVQFFANRESGLVTVNIVNKKGDGGNEVCRINAMEVETP